MLAMVLLVFTTIGPAGEIDAQETKADTALPAGIRLVQIISAPKPILGKQIVFGNQGRELIAVSAEGIHAWEVKSGALRHTWPGAFHALAISADGTTLAAIDAKTEVSLFDVPTRKRLWQFRFSGEKPKKVDKQDNDTAVLSFSPDGKRLAVACFMEVENWDVSERKFLHRFSRETGWYFGAVDFFPDSKRLFVTGFPTYLGTIWNAETGKTEGRMVLLKYTESAKLSPDARVVAAGVNYGESFSALFFFPAGPGNPYRSMRTESPVTGLAFSADGRVVAATCINKKVLLIHAKSFQVADTIATADWSPGTPAFSPDAQLLAMGSNDGKIRLWDLADWRKKLRDYEHLPVERLDQLWQDLTRSGDDPYSDKRAVYQLIAVPDQAVLFLAKKIKPAQRPDPQDIARLLQELDSPQYALRARATHKLQAMDWLIKPALNEALQKKPNVETRRRIENLLANMKSRHDPEHLRQLRAVNILSEIATPTAHQVLHKWAEGAPGAFLTERAQESWKAIEKTKKRTERDNGK